MPFSKVGKAVSITAAALTLAISAGSAGYKLHNMYEDEPHIQLVQQQLEQQQQSNIDKFIRYQQQQEIRQYEDDLDELKEKERDGEADRYDRRKIDRYEKRIKQLEREMDAPSVPSQT